MEIDIPKLAKKLNMSRSDVKKVIARLVQDTLKNAKKELGIQRCSRAAEDDDTPDIKLQKNPPQKQKRTKKNNKKNKPISKKPSKKPSTECPKF